MTTLETQFFFTSPLEVVRVTASNMKEAAEWCGGKVLETASRKNEKKMDSYVWVPTPNGTKLSWAFAGMFITRRIVLGLDGEFKLTYSVFRRPYFEKNYFADPIESIDKTWEAYNNLQRGAKTLDEARIRSGGKALPKPDITKMMGVHASTPPDEVEAAIDVITPQTQGLVQTEIDKLEEPYSGDRTEASLTAEEPLTAAEMAVHASDRVVEMAMSPTTPERVFERPDEHSPMKAVARDESEL